MVFTDAQGQPLCVTGGDTDALLIVDDLALVPPLTFRQERSMRVAGSIVHDLV